MDASTTFTDLAASGPDRRSAAEGAKPAGRILHALRQLECWVAWSIGAYTAWLATFGVADMTLWVFVLYAVLIGSWALVRRSRSQSGMVSRALSLIAGAYALHIHTSAVAGSPGAPFLVWLTVACLFYVFTLERKWAAVLVAFALVQLAVASLRVASPVPVAELLALIGMLCVLPLLLAIKFDNAMRQPGSAMESDRIDGNKSLFNSSGFAAHGNEMLAASRRAGRPLSVAVFNCADLLEVREIYGSKIARELMNRIVDKLSSISASRGLAARTGPAEFSVVLPGMGRDKAVAAIHRVLGKPLSIEMDAGDSEIVLVPEFMVEMAGPDVASVEELHRELHEELVLIEAAQQRRRHYLQRERESHSRPMPLPAMADDRWSQRAWAPQCPTMPLPLAARGAMAA